MSGEDTWTVNIAIASRSRGKGYYEYLLELRQATENFGPYAAEFQLALDLEFASRRPKKKRGHSGSS